MSLFFVSFFFLILSRRCGVGVEKLLDGLQGSGSGEILQDACLAPDPKCMSWGASGRHCPLSGGYPGPSYQPLRRTSQYGECFGEKIQEQIVEPFHDVSSTAARTEDSNIVEQLFPYQSPRESVPQRSQKYPGQSPPQFGHSAEGIRPSLASKPHRRDLPSRLAWRLGIPDAQRAPLPPRY